MKLPLAILIAILPLFALAQTNDNARAIRYVNYKLAKQHNHPVEWFVRDPWLSNAVAEIRFRTNEFKPGVRVDLYVFMAADVCASNGCAGAIPPQPCVELADRHGTRTARVTGVRRMRNGVNELIIPDGNPILFEQKLGHWTTKTSILIPTNLASFFP